MDIEATAIKLASDLEYNPETACDLIAHLLKAIKGGKVQSGTSGGWEIHTKMPESAQVCVPWDGKFDVDREVYYGITQGSITWEFYATHPSLNVDFDGLQCPEHLRPSLVELIKRMGLA